MLPGLSLGIVMEGMTGTAVIGDIVKLGSGAHDGTWSIGEDS